MTLKIGAFAGLSSAAASCAVIAAMVGLTPRELDAQVRTQGQEQAAGPGRVENTQVAVSGGIVSISFDLVSPGGPSTTFEVGLEASQNGGQTYDLKPKTVRGDVGRRVAPGSGKTLVWDAAKDTDSLQLAQLRFRVAINTELLPASQPEPLQRSQLEPLRRGTTPPAKQPVVSGTRKGYLWAGVGMLGLGGFWIARVQSDPNCSAHQKTMLSAAALGIAGTGALVLVKGNQRASRLPSIAPMPKGFLVYKVVQFK